MKTILVLYFITTSFAYSQVSGEAFTISGRTNNTRSIVTFNVNFRGPTTTSSTSTSTTTTSVSGTRDYTEDFVAAADYTVSSTESITPTRIGFEEATYTYPKAETEFYTSTTDKTLLNGGATFEWTEPVVTSGQYLDTSETAIFSEEKVVDQIIKETTATVDQTFTDAKYDTTWGCCTDGKRSYHV